MSVESSPLEGSFGAKSALHGVHGERDGSTWSRLGSRPTARPGSRSPRVAVTLIGVTSFLTSVLVLTAAGHLAKSTLGELPEEIILVVASVAALASVIASLLIHGRRLVFWLFFVGFLLNAFAQADDDLYVTAAGLAFFVGPLAWNMFILRRLVDREDAMAGFHQRTNH